MSEKAAATDQSVSIPPHSSSSTAIIGQHGNTMSEKAAATEQSVSIPPTSSSSTTIIGQNGNTSEKAAATEQSVSIPPPSSSSTAIIGQHGKNTVSKKAAATEQALSIPPSSSSSSVIIGQSGCYQILKVVAGTTELPEGCKTRTRAPKNGSGIQLGIKVRENEWMGNDLRRAFPGTSSYRDVHSVKKGSLADKSGVRPKDILCWHKGPTPIVFHNLLSDNSEKKNESCWELITETRFSERVKKAKAGKPFTFYVARKMPKKPSSAKSSTDDDSSSLKGIVLAQELAMKVKTYPSLSDQEKALLLEEVKKDAKKQFETERDEVLASLPDSVSELFGQIGFARWGRANDYFPVLIVSPFDAPPGDARSLWLQKYKARQEKNTLAKVSLLVYWYGEPEESTECFAIIPQNDLLSWSVGKSKNYHKLPKSIKEKVEAMKNLSEREQSCLRAHVEMEADLKKTPQERLERIEPFQELHELLCADDLADFSDDSRGEKIQTRKRNFAGDPFANKRRRGGANLTAKPTSSQTSGRCPRPARCTTTAPFASTVSSEWQHQTNPSLRYTHTGTTPVSFNQHHIPTMDRNQLIRPSVDEPTAIAFAAFDRFNDHMKNLFIFNRTLRAENTRLKIDAKFWLEKYRALAVAAKSVMEAVDEKTDEEIPSIPSDSKDERSRANTAPTTGSGSYYITSMCSYLEQLKAQNTELQRENGRISTEVNRWRAKHDALKTLMKSMTDNVRKLEKKKK